MPEGGISDQGASGGTRTRNRRIPVALRVNSLSTVPPTPPERIEILQEQIRCTEPSARNAESSSKQRAHT
ncbi:hypothetical protein PoB_001563400 [Plakobranchus ocellatus]|uniref:Uncharacterized protein n=1 Tax=Plakobranchus ocellatus TaxID=259542 RepID=A0AAV3Z1E1_9GAST|nr:hypothetical protein PoB_001563400 [Plakobranchus ocellatus]